MPPIILLPKAEDRWINFEFINTAFKTALKDALEKAFDTNFELRSNFEFNCEKKNLFKNDEIDEGRIPRGMARILKENLMEEARVLDIQKTWNSYSNEGDRNGKN